MIKELTGDTLTKRSTSQGKVATSPRSKLKREIVLPKPSNNEHHDKIPLQMSEDKESKATRKQKQGSLKRFLSPRSYSLGTRKKSTSSSFEVIDSSSVDDVQSSDHSEEEKRSLSRKERESGSKEEFDKKKKGKSPPCGTTFSDDWDEKEDYESAYSSEKRTKAMRSKSERKYEKLRIVDKSDKSDKSELRSEFISERGLENDERDETETDRETERETEERDAEEQEEPIVISIEDTPKNNQSIAVIQAVIRRVNAENELDCRIQFQIQRTHIFFEIVDTEETYFAGLTSLIEDIYEPVLVSTQKSSDPILEPSVFKSLFPEGHVKIIWNAHKGFVQDLRDKKKDWSQYQTVGDVFMKMCGFLRLYTRYAETYSQAEEVIETIYKEKKFMAFLKEKWPNIEPVSHLSSLLITPIQRIPRYQMLLESLYKKTWKTHVDYETLGNALSEMIKTAKHVNDKAKEADNAKKLVLIDASLFGMKSKVSETIVAANRKFVKEGFLHQRTEKGEWKKRYFFLLSDLLIRARANRKQKGSYIFIEKVNLKRMELSRTLHMDVKDLVSKDLRPRCFEVVHPHPIRYTLLASTVEEKNEWCIAFERLLEELHEAEAKHEEAVKKISVNKAHMAKSLIAQSLMQHATVKVPGTTSSGSLLRDRMQSAKSGSGSGGGGSSSAGTAGSSKSRTADPSTIRAYAEHMAMVKMSPQERWANAKQAEQDVQNWEKKKKQQQIEETNHRNTKEAENENKKRDIHQQLNNSLKRAKVRDYREAMAQYRQTRQDSNNNT